MYRDRVALGGQRVDCIAIQYIILQQSCMAGIALQYNTMYYDREGSLRLGTVSRGRPRYGHACAHTRPRHGVGVRGTAPTHAALRPRYGAGRATGTRGEQALALGRWACGRDAAIRPGPRPRYGRVPATIRSGLRAPGRAWVPSWASLGAWAPDTVLTWFLTHCCF